MTTGQAPSPSGDIDSIFKYLRSLGEAEFYGTVALNYTAGKVTLVNIEQRLKPQAITEMMTNPLEEKPRRDYVNGQQIQW
jgi:hypothetical protein